MGTSRSSGGPRGGVPLVPPWVPPPDDLSGGPGGVPDGAPDSAPDGAPDGAPAGQGQDVPGEQNNPQSQALAAPPARFAGARTSLGRFAALGFGGDLGKGLRGYVRKGLGGSSAGTRRLGGTARIAGGLVSVLDQLRTGDTAGLDDRLSPTALAGKTPRQIADRIAESISPADRTQDADASRWALGLATSDLLTMYPDANLLQLTDAQIQFVLERFIGHDLAFRIDLDIGKAVLSNAPDSATGSRRLEEVRSYVQQKTSAVFQAMLKAGRVLTRSTAAKLASDVIRNTLLVFESYV